MKTHCRALSVAFLLTSLVAGRSSAANVVRYGTNAAAFLPGDSGTYTEIVNTTWVQLNAAIAAALNSTTRGFVYISGDVTGSGATTGPITIVGDTGSVGFEFKGAFVSGFGSQDYKAKSVLDAAATSGSKSRVIAVGAKSVHVDGFVVQGGYNSGGDEAGLTFVDTSAGGAGIAIEAQGVHLSNLEVTGNTENSGYKLGGGIFLRPTGTMTARLEYLNIHDNVILSTGARGGGIAISCVNGPTAASVVLAVSFITGNTGQSEGTGVFLQGPKDDGNAAHWTLFGVFVRNNKGTGSGGFEVAGYRYDKEVATMANCTITDNNYIGIACYGGTWSYRRGNVYMNTVIADNSGVYHESSNHSHLFEYSLIDDVSNHGDSAAGTFFGSTDPMVGNAIIDLGNNQQVSDVEFFDPTGADDKPKNDYMLRDTSAGYLAAKAKYNSGGLGFAYVDVDRDNAYDAGRDIIVDVITGAGQYVPAANELYYPTDLNEYEWITIRRYSSTADLAESMNMGAFAPLPPPKGLVILFK